MKRKRRNRQAPSSGAKRRPTGHPGSSERRSSGNARSALAGWFTVILFVAAVLFWILNPSRESPTTGPKSEVRSPQISSPATEPGPVAGRGVAELVNRANDLIRQDKAAESLPLLMDALRLEPDDEDVHYNLGIALSRLGRHEEALEHYHEAIRLFPDYVEAHNNMGNLLQQLGRFDEAIDHFRSAVKIMPDFAVGWNSLGTASQHFGQPAEAAKCFKKAVEIDPDYWQAHLNIGSSAMVDGRKAEALFHFKEVLRLQPDFLPAQDFVRKLESEGSTAPK